MRSNRFLFLLLPLALSACLVQSKVQGRYLRDHDECRNYSERNIDKYLPKDRPVSTDDRNAELVTLFSDCMGKKGWEVAKPKRAESTNGVPSVTAPPPTPAAAAAPAVPPAPPAEAAPSVYQPYGTGPGRNF